MVLPVGMNSIKWDNGNRLGFYGDLEPSAAKMKWSKDEGDYDATKSYKNAAYATWQFANDRSGILFCKGHASDCRCGIVESDYEYDTVVRIIEYPQVKWTQGDGHILSSGYENADRYNIIYWLCWKAKCPFESDVIDDAEEQEVVSPYDTEMFLEEVYGQRKIQYLGGTRT